MELAVEGDRLLAPQAARDLQHLVGAATALARVLARRAKLGRLLAADPEHRQQAAAREPVDRGALFREHEWIAERRDHRVHAELHALGRACERGHRGQ